MGAERAFAAGSARAASRRPLRVLCFAAFALHGSACVAPDRDRSAPSAPSADERPPAAAAPAPRTPAARGGGADDGADAQVVRAIAAELDMPVTLAVETRRERDGWLLMSGRPLDGSGERIDYTGTVFADAIAEGYFDDGFVALLRRERPSARWHLVELALGATDAPFVDWPARHGAPAELLMPAPR